MKKLLIHICCANCATVPIELLKDQFDLTLFWYNPNIQPIKEYQKRLADVKKLSTIYNKTLLSVEIGLQQTEETKLWFKLVKGLEKEPEGGKRCQICFQMRLEKTAQFAKNQGFDFLATTLTTGPQKRAEMINSLGKEISNKYGIGFYQTDFKKNNGFKKSLELSKKYNFYRQNYCGCVYSKNLKIKN